MAEVRVDGYSSAAPMTLATLSMKCTSDGGNAPAAAASATRTARTLPDPNTGAAMADPGATLLNGAIESKRLSVLACSTTTVLRIIAVYPANERPTTGRTTRSVMEGEAHRNTSSAEPDATSSSMVRST